MNRDDLSLEFVRVVEKAAIAGARTMGRGDRKYADQVAAEAMRAERRADGEKTQDRADFQAVDHRGHDGRGAQDDEGILEDEDIAASRHCRQHRL